MFGKSTGMRVSKSLPWLHCKPPAVDGMRPLLWNKLCPTQMSNEQHRLKCTHLRKNEPKDL